MKPMLGDVVRPGAEVGGYRIEKKLGAGGFGHVYLARRDGVACALKFIHPGSVGDWGWRELYIMQRHEFPHVVRLLGHFKWPEDKPEYLVLVMEYVPGPTLYDWAQGNNPCAREVVEKLWKLSRALRQVHAKEVLHRDLKGDNVLVRETDGEVVLVDFGAGSMRGVPRVTRDALAPANARYRSPESVAFSRRSDRTPGERYPYAVTDEMYALGVILYVLVTDQYPFGGPEEELLDEIITSAPTPPSARNSRVPPALNALCLRLLAKEPHARVPDAGALCVELEKLLDEAKGDPRWELPLCYGWTEDGRTTDNAPEVVGKSPPVWMQRWLRRKPKRGKPPPPPSGVPEPPVRAAEHPVKPRRHRGRRTLALGVALVGLAVLVGRSAHAPTSRVLAPHASVDFSPGDPWSWDVPVHEVAPPWKPREADPGAAPPPADTPAPVTTVTLRTDVPRMKKKPSAPLKEKQACGSPVTGLLLGMAASANLACPGAPVRPVPPPTECPAGAIETMSQLGLPIGRTHGFALVPGHEDRCGSNLVPVREGPYTFKLGGDWDVPPYPAKGRTVLPNGTRLSGQLYFGDKIVHGRITQAVTPKGDTFTVCMELFHTLSDERGVEIQSRDGQTALVTCALPVEAVDHFE